MFILCVSLLIVRLPFAHYLQADLGSDAIWWSFPLGSAVSMALALLYYRFGGWKRARFAGDKPATGEAAAAADNLPIKVLFLRRWFCW